MKKNKKEDELASVTELPIADKEAPEHQDVMDLGDPPANVPLAFLENEVKRLQARWTGIEGEVRARDERIDELQGQVDARDLIAANLTQRLEEAKHAEESLQEEIVQLESSLAELKLSQAERDVRLSEKHQQLRVVEEDGEKLQQEIAEAKSQITTLEQDLAAQREGVAESDKRSADLLGIKDELRRKIQDLEHYIDGRTKYWTAKEEELQEYKDTISGMESVLKERDDELRAANKLKDQLSARILDLERRTSELDGRRAERETAYRDLEARMLAQTQETADVRADLGQRVQQADAAIDRLAEAEQTSSSLQRGVERRDESIGELEEALKQQTAKHDKLEKEFVKQGRQVEELQHGLEERLTSNQDLRSALKDAHQEVEEAQSIVMVKTEEMRALEQEARQAQGELAQVREDLERLGEQHRDALDRADEAADRATELDRSMKSMSVERNTLQDELIAQQELVQVLESDLEGKRETLDVLDRSVDRIHELGQSIQELDHNFSDLESFETANDEDQLELMAPAEQLATEADTETANVPAANQVKRLMITLSGELGIKYPIYKRETTIGRSKRNDIHVQSKFISRIHARIIEDEQGLVIEDTGSKNGVTVNAAQITGKRRLLHDGDTICVGEQLFKFVERAQV